MGFRPSPEKVPADEDVIRTAQIYQPAEVAPQGESVILDDEDAFSNAREPLAQAYAPKDASGTPEAEKTFVTVSNHFKSKGSGEGPGNEDTGDGQGFSNADRVKQAKSLVDFAGEQQKAADSDYVYLLGDFNSYTQEDPMQVLYESGYKDVGSEMTDKSTYVFKGRTGGLDHILALDTSGTAGTGDQADLPTSAFDAVTGADIWSINSVEPLAFEYSRFNYNISDLYEPNQFRASDHDPVLVGLFDEDSRAEAMMPTADRRTPRRTTTVRTPTGRRMTPTARRTMGTPTADRTIPTAIRTVPTPTVRRTMLTRTAAGRTPLPARTPRQRPRMGPRRMGPPRAMRAAAGTSRGPVPSSPRRCRSRRASCSSEPRPWQSLGVARRVPSTDLADALMQPRADPVAAPPSRL